MILVLNEWIFHDLLLENGMDKFRETAEFLKAFHNSADLFVLPAEPRWKAKAYQLMTQSDPSQRAISKVLHAMLVDSDRARVVIDEPQFENPEADYSRVPEEDIYLLVAYRAACADLLVTTDKVLSDALMDLEQVNCALRDEFLATYMR